MVVYNVYSQSVLYNYKTYICSKATLVWILTATLTILFPVIFTYRSYGFWLRTDQYQEQPNVSFKYDYILLIDTAQQDSLIMCSNLPHLSQISQNFNYCPLIKAREEDFNRDGLNDILHFSSLISLQDGDFVHGITLLLFFDYKIWSFCRVHMEGLGVVQHSSPLAGSAMSIVADLSLTQRRPLSLQQNQNLHNASIVPQAPAFSLASLLSEYALRNVSTKLTNVYTTWDTNPIIGEPFTVNITILYTEVSVHYIPTMWQRLKDGWIKFFPILFLSVLLFNKIKNFIFKNQLVYTYKEVPWKKDC